MYQPATPTVADGATAVRPVAVAVVLRVTILSSKPIVWFDEPGWISTARLVVSGVAMVKLAPFAACAGDDVMVGRAPRDRYGGVKISSVLPPPPAPVSPAENTRPSGSRTAEEWYARRSA